MRRALAGAVCLTAACALVHRGRPAGDALRARRLMVPVAGVSPADVPDTFRARRGWRGIHGAVDIVAPRGAPVVSADDGRVLRLRRNRKGGVTLYATDPTQRFIYYYAHLQAYGRGITPGCRLVRGQVIGFVRTTANQHIHPGWRRRVALPGTGLSSPRKLLREPPRVRRARARGRRFRPQRGYRLPGDGRRLRAHRAVDRAPRFDERDRGLDSRDVLDGADRDHDLLGRPAPARLNRVDEAADSAASPLIAAPGILTFPALAPPLP